jgi:hypothetical protein
MLTLPAHIASIPGWNDRSGPQPNLQSRMDFGEHQQIVFNALHLLANFFLPDINEYVEKLEQLADAVDSSDLNDVLYIAKGIHQRDSNPPNPHIQLRLKRGGTWYNGIHLELSESDVPDTDERFTWVGVRFTAGDDTPVAWWPQSVNNRVMLCRSNPLRRSIAPKDIPQAKAAYAQAKLVEQQKAAQAAQAAQDEKDKNEAIRKIRAALTGNGWKIENRSEGGIFDRGVNRLAKGDPIEVQTKNGRKKVKFDGRQLVNA